MYKSTVAFTRENAAEGAQPVTEDTVGFYKQYALATPVAEGYTFLGWFMQDENGNLTKVTELSYSGTGGKTVEVEALWVKNLTLATTASDTAKGIGIKRYYAASATITGGGELSGPEWLDRESVSCGTNYVFDLQKRSGTAASVYQEMSRDGLCTDKVGFEQYESWAGGEYFKITVTVTYRYTYTAADGSQQTIELGTVSQYAEQGW